MAGFDLKEGFYEDREVSEDELWDAVACVFTSKSKNDKTCLPPMSKDRRTLPMIRRGSQRVLPADYHDNGSCNCWRFRQWPASIPDQGQNMPIRNPKAHQL